MNIIYPLIETFTGVELREFPSVEFELEKVVRLFREADLKQNLIITLALAEVDGILVRNYEARIVSRFTDAENDDFYIGTADGHVVNISQMVADAKEKLKNGGV